MVEYFGISEYPSEEGVLMAHLMAKNTGKVQFEIARDYLDDVIKMMGVNLHKAQDPTEVLALLMVLNKTLTNVHTENLDYRISVVTGILERGLKLSFVLEVLDNITAEEIKHIIYSPNPYEVFCAKVTVLCMKDFFENQK